MDVVTLATSLDIRAISPNIGAEVWGLDLSRPLGDDVVAEVRAALCRHLVLFFPDQDLAPEVQADFARQFGEVTPAHPVIPSIEGNPEVLPIDGREDRASWWHTDVTFLQTPPLGSILHMREAPARRGRHHVGEPAGRLRRARRRRSARCATSSIAWHHDPWFAADVEAKGGYEWDGRHHDRLFPVSHPVVRTHPETGRNGLFVNSQFTRFLEGVSPARERRAARHALPALPAP